MSSLDQVQVHQRSNQSSSSVQPIWCMKCPVKFSTLKMYHRHLAESHPETLPYSCSICGKGFQTKTGQQIHVQAHAGRLYLCGICDSKFKRKHHLQEHTKRLHNLIQCGRCLATFSDQHGYNQHLLSSCTAFFK
ncbi:unnamed protein product [Lymnaea stagnalis]|uniref:C2H2-type domain-containing protein n=1 Tax=Lymnaea stagnalis TaxID=6523 RepID=A0AAV2H907_LYMST